MGKINVNDKLAVA